MAVDTRSYNQIWATLNASERSELTSALMRDLGCADSTLRNYRLDNRTPSPLHQKVMARTIARVTGISASPAFLFPDGRYAKALQNKMSR